jgi:hypothetical protein
MKGRFIPVVGVLTIVLAVVAPSAAAPPAATSVAIARQATFVNPSEIVVRVTLECPAGTDVSIQVGVSQQQSVGPNATGAGYSSPSCTGAKETIPVTVTGGPFTPGEAFAGVFALDNEVYSSVEDQRVIAIS